MTLASMYTNKRNSMQKPYIIPQIYSIHKKPLWYQTQKSNTENVTVSMNISRQG